MQHFAFNPNWSLERYSAERNGADNFLSYFIFLLASYVSLVLVLVYNTKVSTTSYMLMLLEYWHNIRVIN